MLSALGDFELNWHGSVFHASGCETRLAFRMVSGVYTTAIHAVGCLLLTFICIRTLIGTHAPYIFMISQQESVGH